MILAAGKGTRLQPLTDTKPKSLIEVNGKPLLQYAIEHLKFHGVDDIIINIHHFGQQIVDFIKSNHAFGINISFSDESELLLDTAGGLKKAEHFFDREPFFLYASDVITNVNLKELLHFHNTNKALATLAIKKRNTSRSLLFNETKQLCGWIHNTTKETIICRQDKITEPYGFSGIHCLSPEIFKHLEPGVVFPIVKKYLEIAGTNTVLGFDQSQTPWFEFGRIEKLEETENTLKEIAFSL